MFSGGVVTGPLLIGIFILAIAVLLVLIIKFKLNAFVALLVTAFGTGVLVNMPLPDVAKTVSDGFGSTLGSIGMVWVLCLVNLCLNPVVLNPFQTKF